MASPPPAPLTAPSRTTPHAIARFADVKDTHPKSSSTAWATFAAQLGYHERRAHKDGPCFSPCAYPFGARRGSRYVQYLSMLVVDYDGVAPDFGFLDAQRLTYLGYTTWSHGVRGPRWRVALPLARDVPTPAWRDTYSRALTLFSGADPACRDPSRLHYFPACPLSPPVAPEVRFRDTGLSLLSTNLPPVPVARRSHRGSGARWAARLLRDGAPQGARNWGCFRLAAFCQHFSLPQDFVLTICLAYAARCQPPLDQDEVESVITGVYRRYEPGHEVSW